MIVTTLKSLYSLQYRLQIGIKRAREDRGPQRITYSRPQPLSAQIKQAPSSASPGRSQAYKRLMEREEMWDSLPQQQQPFTPFRNKVSLWGFWDGEMD